MKLFIHFDESGRILSVGKMHAMHEAEHPFLHVAAPDQVVEIEATPELQELDAHEIAERYVVDPGKRALRKAKAAGGKKKPAKANPE